MAVDYHPMKLGVIAELLQRPLRECLDHAAALGFEGVQLHAASSACDLLSLGAEDLEALRRLCHDRGLEITAVCGDLPGHGFQIAADNEARLATSCRIADLTRALGCRIVTTHVGVIPADRASATYAAMLQALTAFGAYAWNRGLVVAIETGPEPAAVLRRFLDDAGTPGLAANLDPANLVMVLGEDPAAAVRTLAGSIVHTHAKDGVRHRACDPLRVYNAFAEGGFARLLEETGELFSEKPLGQGDVPWDRYLAALAETGYDGFLTLERETGENPERDLAQGLRFLRARLAKHGLAADDGGAPTRS